MTFEIKGNSLVITAPLKKGALSKSGKSFVVATTNGNQKTGLQVDGKEIILGLNAYTKAE
jgi:hypothetical protein